MRTLTRLFLGLVPVILAGCHDSNDDAATPSGEALVTALIQDNTTDSAEPVDVNDLDLDFSEDENAFTDLLDG